MITRIVEWCTRHSLSVIAIAVALAAGGEWARRALPRDAVPDLSDPQIGIVVDWMGHPAAEVAARITRVLTDDLRHTAGATTVRGASMAGMAYVDVVFGSASNLDPSREEIRSRVEALRPRLPPAVRIQVGPSASSTGWIYQYALVDPSRSPAFPAGRDVQEGLLRPALQAIPGVAEVASVGEIPRQVLVETEPDRLRAQGVSFSDVAAAVRAHAGDPEAVDVIETLPMPLPGETGKPRLRIGDVAHATITGDMPFGIADFDGAASTVGGIVVARRDADPRVVIEKVRRTLDQLRPELPRNLKIVTVYDRLDLANRVEHTLLRALAEEVGVVVLVILLFLLHGRSALVPLATLPLVLFLTFVGMRLLGVSATIMSLGGIGIALGMAVDADVVSLEACHRRLEAVALRGSPRRAALVAAAGSFAPAILTSLLITALSFLPVLAFTGETGRLLRPLALTKTLVIASAALVAVTAAPALRERLVRGRILPEFQNPLTSRLVRLYRPFVHFALSRPALTLATAAFAVLSCLPILTHLGGEFLPRVDEGDLLFMPSTLPGVPPGQAAVQLHQMDEVLARFPEVAAVFGKVGRAYTATDPAPYSMAESTIRLRPHTEWPPVKQARWYSGWAPRWLAHPLGLVWPEQRPETTAELVDKLDHEMRFPGWVNAWTAPARARMDMMATGGVRTPIGIRIVAADPARLDAHRERPAEVGGAPARYAERRVRVARRGAVAAVHARPGRPGAARRRSGAGPLDGRPGHQRRTGGGRGAAGGPTGPVDPVKLLSFSKMHHAAESRANQPERVRVVPDMRMVRQDADQLGQVTVHSASGRPVPLALLGRPSYLTAPATLRTENGELVAYVYVDLAPGTDVASYVRDGQLQLEQAQGSGEIRVQPGERIEWSGQYQLLAAGERRLAWISLLVVASMVTLLFLQFRSLTEALIVLISVPFALVGSFWTLFLLHYPLSAPVWVGLLSTVGLAMQTGVVMVVYIDDAFYRRVREGRIRNRQDIVEAHAEGTIRRLRPKVMTVTTMAAGLLPLLWADGAGAEIMKRVAAPMVGGLATSAFLTLEVLPVLYTIWRGAQLRRSQRSGVPLPSIVGPAPGWVLPGAPAPHPAAPGLRFPTGTDGRAAAE